MLHAQGRISFHHRLGHAGPGLRARAELTVSSWFTLRLLSIVAMATAPADRWNHTQCHLRYTFSVLWVRDWCVWVCVCEQVSKEALVFECLWLCVCTSIDHADNQPSKSSSVTDVCIILLVRAAVSVIIRCCIRYSWFIIVHRYQPIDVLKCFGSAGSLPFMPVELSGISIDICICKFLRGGRTGHCRAAPKAGVHDPVSANSQCWRVFKQETVGCCPVDDPDLRCLWRRANAKGWLYQQELKNNNCVYAQSKGRCIM